MGGTCFCLHRCQCHHLADRTCGRGCNRWTCCDQHLQGTRRSSCHHDMVATACVAGSALAHPVVQPVSYGTARSLGLLQLARSSAAATAAMELLPRGVSCADCRALRPFSLYFLAIFYLAPSLQDLHKSSTDLSKIFQNFPSSIPFHLVPGQSVNLDPPALPVLRERWNTGEGTKVCRVRLRCATVAGRGRLCRGQGRADVSFVDDVSVMVAHTDGHELVYTAKAIAQCWCQTAERRGLLVNFKPEKTELMLTFRGKGSRSLKQQHFVLSDPEVVLDAFAIPHKLQLVHSYKHVGTQIQADGHPRKDIQYRIAKAKQAWGPCTSLSLRNVKLQLRPKCRFSSLWSSVVLLSRFMCGRGPLMTCWINGIMPSNPWYFPLPNNRWEILPWKL